MFGHLVFDKSLFISLSELGKKLKLQFGSHCPASVAGVSLVRDMLHLAGAGGEGVWLEARPPPLSIWLRFSSTAESLPVKRENSGVGDWKALSR
jgi:hypothetical protein